MGRVRVRVRVRGARHAALAAYAARGLVRRVLGAAVRAGRAQGRGGRAGYAVASLLAWLAPHLPFGILELAWLGLGSGLGLGLGFRVTVKVRVHELAWLAQLALGEVGHRQGASQHLGVSGHRRDAARAARRRCLRRERTRAAGRTVVALMQGLEAGGVAEAACLAWARRGGACGKGLGLRLGLGLELGLGLGSGLVVARTHPAYSSHPACTFRTPACHGCSGRCPRHTCGTSPARSDPARYLAGTWSATPSHSGTRT